MPARLILASGSPRRRELLRVERVEFDLVVSDIPEVALEGESPATFAQRMARAKASAVALENPQHFVLGADTVVALDGIIFGKPIDATDAQQMLGQLAGRTHTVFTGVALVGPDGQVDELTVGTHVTLRPISPDEIAAYVATGEPLDKAGSYGAQGGAGSFIAELDGSYTNVVGLPVEETMALLRRRAVPGVQP
jgi:septum formation protein